MAKTEEVESALRESLDKIIQHGVVLIYGEYGVAWDPRENHWTWDRQIFTATPHCCCIGAYMVTHQPAPDPAHNDDIYNAAVASLKVDPAYLRDLMNGYDDFEYQGGYPDAFALGVRLRQIYRPLCFEFLVLSGSAGIRVSDHYLQYLQDFCLPDSAQRHAAIPEAPASESAVYDKPSGTYPLIAEQSEEAKLGLLPALAG